MQGLRKRRRTLWMVPFDVKRIVFGGKEIWARRIISVNENEVVYEDLAGTVRIVRKDNEGDAKEKNRMGMPLTL